MIHRVAALLRRRPPLALPLDAAARRCLSTAAPRFSFDLHASSVAEIHAILEKHARNGPLPGSRVRICPAHPAHSYVRPHALPSARTAAFAPWRASSRARPRRPSADRPQGDGRQV